MFPQFIGGITTQGISEAPLLAAEAVVITLEVICVTIIDVDKVKLWLVVGVGGLFFLFAFQNMASVEVQFLFWNFETRRFFVLFLMLALGFTVGWLLGAHRVRNARRTKGNTLSDDV